MSVISLNNFWIVLDFLKANGNKTCSIQCIPHESLWLIKLVRFRSACCINISKVDFEKAITSILPKFKKKKKKRRKKKKRGLTSND